MKQIYHDGIGGSSCTYSSIYSDTTYYYSVSGYSDCWSAHYYVVVFRAEEAFLKIYGKNHIIYKYQEQTLDRRCKNKTSTYELFPSKYRLTSITEIEFDKRVEDIVSNWIDEDHELIKEFQSLSVDETFCKLYPLQDILPLLIC